MDELRLGRVLRAIRRRRGWRQTDLAAAAGVSQQTVSRAERGLIKGLSIDALSRTTRALDARLRIDVWWRGGLADQLLDMEHAGLGATVTDRLHAWGWVVHPEVTFQRFGERGSIDLLAGWKQARAACVIELKSVVHSYEETQRRLDVKARHASSIVEQRMGWRPRFVGMILVVGESTTNRRRLGDIEPLVRAGLPATSREVRRWLARPSGPLRGLWFVAPTRGRSCYKRPGGRERVRVARPDRTGQDP
jgi:transcriptional regulator with XRE-family HTH domain